MIKRITEYLKRPYPQLRMAQWKSTLITCGVVALLFIFFEPFGIAGRMGIYRWIAIGGFMLISALCVNLPGWVLPALLGKAHFEERNWTVGKNIAYYLFILLLIAIGNYLFICTLFEINGSILSSFLVIAMDTLFVGIFPIGLITILTENHQMSRHLKEIAGMNEQIREGRAADNAMTLPDVVLPDGLKDSLLLAPDSLLLAAADGNYVKIVFYQDGKVQQRSLRITMKQVEDAFMECAFVQKCHRAFLVNLHHIDSVKGNSQGYHLVLKDWKEDIPVSRAYNKEIREKVAHFFKRRGL